MEKEEWLEICGFGDSCAAVDMDDCCTMEAEVTINGRTCTDSVGGMCE